VALDEGAVAGEWGRQRELPEELLHSADGLQDSTGKTEAEAEGGGGEELRGGGRPASSKDSELSSQERPLAALPRAKAQFRPAPRSARTCSADASSQRMRALQVVLTSRTSSCSSST
jgi:hypothetical protein